MSDLGPKMASKADVGWHGLRVVGISSFIAGETVKRSGGGNVQACYRQRSRHSHLGCPLSAISGCEQEHQIAPIQSTSSLYQFCEDYDCER